MTHPQGRADGSLAVFTSSDDAYVPMAVLALRSFKRFHPELSYYLLGNEADLSESSKQLVAESGIELVDLAHGVQFERQGKFKDAYSIGTFFRLAGPEVLAGRGHEFSLYVDGDVYCKRPLDLESLTRDVRDYAARPIGTLARALGHKQAERNVEYDFAPERVDRDLGLSSTDLESAYEYGNGVIVWNNFAMRERGFYALCQDIFHRCERCFESDQDLLAFVAASLEFEVKPLPEEYHFSFFMDSEFQDAGLARAVRAGDYDRVRIAHFVFLKPWAPLDGLSPLESHFVNEWRRYACAELGELTTRYFGALPALNPRSGAHALWQRFRRAVGRRVR